MCRAGLRAITRFRTRTRYLVLIPPPPSLPYQAPKHVRKLLEHQTNEEERNVTFCEWAQKARQTPLREGGSIAGKAGS